MNGGIVRPERLGILCAIGAVALGLAYMAAAGAPLRYLLVNAGALVLGLATMVLAPHIAARALLIGGAAVLVATAGLGDRVEGAARWITVGPLFIQTSLILLPAMIVTFVRSRDALGTVAIIAAAAAMAAQPDRAMAGMLVAGLAVAAMGRMDRFILAGLAASVIGFAVTLLRADTLPAMPYVDQILYTAFAVHPLAGVAVSGGAALLLVPAIAGALREGDRPVHLVFGAIWFAAILAAALGNYPTPIVGYGGSAILGYLLSVAMLPRTADFRRATGRQRESEPARTDPPLRRTLAA